MSFSSIRVALTIAGGAFARSASLKTLLVLGRQTNDDILLLHTLGLDRRLVARAGDQGCKPAPTVTARGAIRRTAWWWCARAAKVLGTFCADRASRATPGTLRPSGHVRRSAENLAYSVSENRHHRFRPIIFYNKKELRNTRSTTLKHVLPSTVFFSTAGTSVMNLYVIIPCSAYSRS